MIDPNDLDSPKCRQCGKHVAKPGNLCGECQLIEPEKPARDMMKLMDFALETALGPRRNE